MSRRAVSTAESGLKFIVMFKPPAVGKMSVGRELAKLTGLRPFHNHVTIDLVLNFFDFGHPNFHRLVSGFRRRRIFEEVAASELPRLVFTFVRAPDLESERAHIESVCNIFRGKGAEIYFVEREAKLSEGLRRNGSEFRLTRKPPERDIKISREKPLAGEEKYRPNSDGDFFYGRNYLKIENPTGPRRKPSGRSPEVSGWTKRPRLLKVSGRLPLKYSEPIRQEVHAQCRNPQNPDSRPRSRSYLRPPAP